MSSGFSDPFTLQAGKTIMDILKQQEGEHILVIPCT